MFKFLNMLPEKKSSKWKTIFLFFFIGILLVLSLLFILFLETNFKDIQFMKDIFLVLLLAFIPSLAISLSGYFGAKFTPITAIFGVLVGFGFMINFLSKGHKLSGLVGGVAFFDLVIISIAVGLIIDLIYYFYNKYN